MSDPQKPDEETSGLEELSPGLREAIGAVLGRPMPEDLARETLEGVRTRFAQKAPRPVRRAVVWVILAAAASIGAMVLYHQMQESRPTNPPTRSATPPSLAATRPTGAAEDLPTVWAYGRAAEQSPEAFEALLDRHARRLLPPEPGPPQAGFSLAPVQGVL